MARYCYYVLSFFSLIYDAHNIESERIESMTDVSKLRVVIMKQFLFSDLGADFGCTVLPCFFAAATILKPARAGLPSLSAA
jgi:hypothetical protein